MMNVKRVILFGFCITGLNSTSTMQLDKAEADSIEINAKENCECFNQLSVYDVARTSLILGFELSCKDEKEAFYHLYFSTFGKAVRYKNNPQRPEVEFERADKILLHKVRLLNNRDYYNEYREICAEEK